MSKWTPAYSGKERKPHQERFACTGCEAVVDAPHSIGPPNKVCHCDKHLMSIPSDTYMKNFDSIEWN